MTTPEFLLGLFDGGILLYVGALILFLAVGYVYLRTIFVSLFDPIMLILLTAAIDCSALMMLYLMGAISISTLSQSIIATGAFFWAIKIFSKSSARSKYTKHLKFSISVSMVVATTLAFSKYFFWGLPLLNEDSRLDGYFGEDQGSYAAVVMTGEVISGVVLCKLAEIRNICRRNRRIFIAYTIFYFIDGVLSGSKIGPILTMASIWYFSQHLAEKHRVAKVPASVYICLVVVLISTFSVASILRYGVEDAISGLRLFGFRIVQTSDIYYYSASEGSLYSPYEGLVGFFNVSIPIVGRLLGGEPQAQSLGQIVFEHAHGFSNVEAPNARLIAIAVSTVGWGGVAITFLVGALVGIARRVALRERASLLLPLFLITPAIFLDVPYTVGRLKWAVGAAALLLILTSALKIPSLLVRSKHAYET